MEKWNKEPPLDVVDTFLRYFHHNSRFLEMYKCCVGNKEYDIKLMYRFLEEIEKRIGLEILSEIVLNQCYCKDAEEEYREVTGDNFVVLIKELLEEMLQDGINFRIDQYKKHRYLGSSLCGFDRNRK